MDREKALLMFALMWNIEKEENLKRVEKEIEKTYGRIISQSETFTLPYSKYYQREMGKNLIKKFVVIDSLIHKGELVDIKKFSMSLEDRYRINGSRTVNIDPLYLEEFQVVVSTSKYRGSRIYLKDGIYADLELLYYNGSYQPMIWTYLDYRDHIGYFNRVRKLFFEKVRKIES